MPPVELPPAGILLANIGMWAVAHAASGYAVHTLPLERLGHDGWLLRLRRAEEGGRVYERVLRIRRWKDRLPEAGDLFAGGLSKRSLPGADDGGVERFVRETRRAELGHWLSLLALPAFPLWNPPVGVALMALYGVAVNLPFIVVQRYNRGRAQGVLAARADRSSGSRRHGRPDGASRTRGSSMP